MVSGKTGNFDLNQWAQSDPILMEDFNSDNAKTDAALKTLQDSSTHVFLREIVTGSDALQVDLDISDIDWSKYRHILMLVDARCAMGSVVIRLNGLAASGDYRYLNSDLAQINSTAWGSFLPNTPAVTYRICLNLTGGITYPECNTTAAGTALSRTYFCVNALANPAVTVNLSNSTAPIEAGSTIIIYGVKI